MSDGRLGRPAGRPAGLLQQRSYLEKVLGALLQVLGKHGRVEGLAFMLQQPALVPGLVCGQLLIVQPPVTLSHTLTV